MHGDELQNSTVPRAVQMAIRIEATSPFRIRKSRNCRARSKVKMKDRLLIAASSWGYLDILRSGQLGRMGKEGMSPIHAIAIILPELCYLSSI
jgi:hypothetical protein